MSVEIAPIDSLPAIDCADGSVGIWLFFYEEPMRDEALCDEYEALMSDDERARYRRFRFEKDRRAFLATRALVRTALSHYAPDTAPACWRFVANEHGKPRIDSDVGLHFNLSNTPGLVVCAVSRNHEALGVDTESLRRRSDTVAVADRFFSPSEITSLHAVAESDRLDRFFSYWTLKESYIKARGLGSAIPLDQFSFELDAGDDIAIVFDAALDDDPHRWQFALWRASADHFVASGVSGVTAFGSAKVVPLR